MKLYNPFKPHVVQGDDGKYYVRKVEGLFFNESFMDKFYPPYWWYSQKYVSKYCACDTLAEAKLLLAKVNEEEHKGNKHVYRYIQTS